MPRSRVHTAIDATTLLALRPILEPHPSTYSIGTEVRLEICGNPGNIPSSVTKLRPPSATS